jgi:SOS-response transcriptional repressor LexA
MQKKLIKNQQVEIEIPFEDINNNTIPLYNIYAAAGSFSEMQDEKEFSLIPVPERYKTEDYFACKVCGESMNKIIPNKSICIFKNYFAGSRSGKILLI